MLQRSNSLTRAALRVQLKMVDVAYLKDELTESFHGREPSLNDLIWAHLNKRALHYASQRAWGLYRNTRLTMAAQVYGEKHLKCAIQFLCEVMFLDLNGAQNVGTINGKPAPLDPKHPDFDPSRAFPAPAVISALVDLAGEAGLKGQALGELFKTWTAEACGGLPAPLSISETWARVAELLPPTTDAD